MALTSCHHNEDEVDTTPVAIGMSPNLDGFFYTRALYDDNETVGNTTNLRTEGFAVYGWKNVNNAYTQVFNGTLVKGVTSSTTAWEYSPLKYWDRAAKSYDFVAYAPQGTNVTATAPTSTTAAKLSFTNIPQWQPITTEDNKAAAKDYIVARNSNTVSYYLNEQTNKGVVHFDFYHMLARLTIKAYCEANVDDSNVKYIISGISISSKGKVSDTATELKVPTAARSCTFEAAEAPSGGILADNITFDAPANTSRAEYTILNAVQTVGEKTMPSDDACIPSPNKATPTLVGGCLVAPFNIAASSFGYDSTDADKCLTLNVTYWTKTKTGQKDTAGNDLFEWKEYKNNKVNLIFKDKDDNLVPLQSFVSHGDYVITLNLDKGHIAVLLDVAITPWSEETTSASPRTVYNW